MGEPEFTDGQPEILTFSHICALPFDLRNLITSHIDSPHDLSALARTNSEWAHLIIPRHIEYRRLCLIAEPHARIWEHLAQRADLAQNIREVRMLERRAIVESSSERFPRTLPAIESQELEPQDGRAGADDSDERITQNIVQALGNMKNLRIFCWRLHPRMFQVTPKSSKKQILEVLSRSRTLVELRIDNVRYASCLGFSEDEFEDTNKFKSFPLWNIANLTSLTLSGIQWSEWQSESQLTSMLRRSPYLEELTICYLNDSPSFRSCHFPNLRKLHLAGWPVEDNVAIDKRVADELILEFLGSHPTIEDLKWEPLSRQEMRTAPGLLPNLKHIDGSHTLILSLLHDQTQTLARTRTLESIGGISIKQDVGGLEALENISGRKLTHLYITSYFSLQELRCVAELFPALRILEISPWLDGYHPMGDHLDTLSHFSELEYYANPIFWYTLHADYDSEEQKKALLEKTAHRCPRLVVIGNRIGTPYMTIKSIVRSGEEISFKDSRSVRWTIGSFKK